MLAYLEKSGPPSDDSRWKIVGATMRKLGNQRHALIEALHSLQESFGYLNKPGLKYIAGTLKLPLSQVYGAATFYHHFTMEPRGKHTCVVCTGTACYIKGANELLKSITPTESVRPGETTMNGEFSILTARCFGTCGLAPMVVIDGKTEGHITPADLQARIERITQHVD